MAYNRARIDHLFVYPDLEFNVS